MIPYSVLDLCPILEGGDVRAALNSAANLARAAEELGYLRYWAAEHHNMPGIASAATSVVLAHVGHATKTIRIGAGGIMLPNHAPLQVAEQFGTLAALFPGRVDLGLGRAPGTDQLTMRALRRTLHSNPEAFPQDVLELLAYLGPTEEGQRLRAVPGANTNVPLYILGSSLFGAQVAAALGLPFAFASHFAPAQMMDALRIYRERFRPSDYAAAPYVILGVQAIAAETDEEAEYLATSGLQAFAALMSGAPRALPPPQRGYQPPPELMAMRAGMRDVAAIGSAKTVAEKLAALRARTQADEFMLTAQIYDEAARQRSFELIMRTRTLARGQPAFA